MSSDYTDEFIHEITILCAPLLVLPCWLLLIFTLVSQYLRRICDNRISWYETRAHSRERYTLAHFDYVQPLVTRVSHYRLKDERDFIWGGTKWTAVTWMFLLNRYVMKMTGIMSSLPLNVQVCRTLDLFLVSALIGV